MEKVVHSGATKILTHYQDEKSDTDPRILLLAQKVKEV